MKCDRILLAYLPVVEKYAIDRSGLLRSPHMAADEKNYERVSIAEFDELWGVLPWIVVKLSVVYVVVQNEMKYALARLIRTEKCTIHDPS